VRADPATQAGVLIPPGDILGIQKVFKYVSAIDSKGQRWMNRLSEDGGVYLTKGISYCIYYLYFIYVKAITPKVTPYF
jgi:hypothetical protein